MSRNPTANLVGMTSMEPPPFPGMEGMSSEPQLSREMQDILNDENCEELEPGSGSVHAGFQAKPAAAPSSLFASNGGGFPKSNTNNGNPIPPSTLNINPKTSDGFNSQRTAGHAASPAAAAASGMEGVSVGDSPTDHLVAATRATDFISSTRAKTATAASAAAAVASSGSNATAAAAAAAGTSSTAAAAMMTVTSPAWSGTSWTGGLTYGCTAALKSSAGGGSGGSTSTTAVPLSAPATPTSGGGAATTPINKLESIKNWTISTYKCSRQTIYEKLGKTSRTVDSELESQIETLRDTQRKYANILRLARALTSHFYHVVQTQSSLGECFNDLAHRSPELQEEFLYNAETQRNLTKNGQALIGALNFFVSSVNTLCNKTMEDTIATVRQYETARVEYDAYRSDLDYYSTTPQTDISLQKQRETEEVFARQKLEFEKLRSDVQIKLKFLDENRVKVMHKQLLLFHNAISAYFSGNQTALEATMKQFSIKVKSPNAAPPSWMEQ